MRVSKLFLVVFLLTATVASAGVTVVDQTRIGPLVRTEAEVQVGPTAIETFTLTRVRSVLPISRGVLLLLPPLGNDFAFYETDESGVYLRSFAAFFALRGWEVWGYSPRTSNLVAPACEDGTVDCSVLDEWGIQAVVDDVGTILDLMDVVVPNEVPILGGYSLGGITTVATLDAYPHAFSGAMILEGTLYSDDPAIQARNAPYCAGLEAALAAGAYWDGQSLPGVRLSAQLARDDPDGPTPLPGFPPGTTNHQAFVAFLALPQDGPLWPTPDFTRCAGSVEEDRFFFCDDERVITFSLIFNDYVANRVVRDIACGIAGERTFTDNLDAFTGPVYVLAGGLAFDEMLDDTLGLLGSTDVTVNEIEPFGHADHWFVGAHRLVLERSILRWLRSTF